MSRSRKPQRKRRSRSANKPRPIPPAAFLAPEDSQYDDLPFTITTLQGASVAASIEYIQAHTLMPYDFDGANGKDQTLVLEALETLRDENASEQAQLRAIVILGHTPTPAAFDTLQRYVASGRRHAEVARLAADECTSWMRFAPPRAAVGRAGMCPN